MTEKPQPDPIRETVAARMKELGLSAYAVAKRTEGAVSARTLQRWLAGTRSLGSELLGHVLSALDLELTKKE